MVLLRAEKRRGDPMSKGMEKKKPTKTLMEKRAEKKAKKAARK